jgi:sugar (pentulose or hexulose) kinase
VVARHVFDENGNANRYGRQEYVRSYPNPGWVELDANSWWSAVATAIRLSIEDSNSANQRIASIGISAETDGILAVGEKGEPLRPYIHWFDTRCVNEHIQLRSEGRFERIYQLTGIPVQGGYDFPALKMQWIKKNEQDVYEQTRKFLSIGTFMLYKLTGKYVADPSTASRSLLFDIRKREWSEELSDYFGIPISRQPEIRSSNAIVGTVTPAAARETGLSTEAVVVAGGGDTECSTLGAGVTSENQALISIGTSLMVAVPRNEPFWVVRDEEMRLWGTGAACTSHVVDKMWVLEVGAPVGGAILAWFSREFGETERRLANQINVSAYDILGLEAENAKPTLDSPIFAAPTGAIVNIRNEHKRCDLIRCIFEGVAFEAKEVIEVFEKSGLNIEELIVGGGGAKSIVWRQILSDVTNKSVSSSPIQETAAAGAAILAGRPVGLFKKRLPSENAKKMVSTPTADFRATYAFLYDKYKRLYKALK